MSCMTVRSRRQQPPFGSGCLAALLLFLARSVQADNGGYVDLTFTCDVTVTCPQICAKSINDCPSLVKCSGTATLCNDGSCATFCDPSLTSPCQYISPCAPVACASIDTFYDSCKNDFGPWYEFASNCTALLDDDAASGLVEPNLSWTKWSYILVYAWASTVTVAIISWCWYNQRFNPVEGSTVTIQAKLDDMADTRMTHQTAYKRHFVGTVLYILTMVTFFGWFALLNVVRKMLFSTVIAEDFFTAVRTFTVVWFAGYLWSCTLLWPHTIESLFLRRCVFAEATHIAVFHDANESLNLHQANKSQNSRLPACLQSLLAKVTFVVDSYMTLVFADPHCRPDRSNGMFQFCPVMRNDDQSQYIIFTLRHYNFDQNKGVYLPAFFAMPSTIRELVASSGASVVGKTEKENLEQPMESPHLYLGTKGLSTLEVEERYRAVGKNVMQMNPPSLLGTFVEEIFKPFYLYQIYIIWLWAVSFYMSGAVTIWTVVLLTACIVSWFRFRGAQALYRLSHVTDEATVLRDGQLVMINQVCLVPGDIVKVSPGVIHSDMLLLTGETLVDESALTGEATPQAKSQVDPSDGQPYNPVIHKKQTLSAGTCVIECDDYSYALVLKTASNTTKGEILRNVLVFRRHDIKFRSELPVVISLLAAYSTIIVVFVTTHVNTEFAYAFLIGMSAYANAFPAILPSTFVIPVGISFERLNRTGIACSNSDSILIAAQVNVAFFDKTGTLTKQGLDYVSARSADSWNSGQWTSDTLAMAKMVCHSLISAQNGDLIGNPVDRAMFATTCARLLHVAGATATIESADGAKYEILRRFEFDHNRMTQSVVVQLPDGVVRVFVKGSGEQIRSLCGPDTVPNDYLNRLQAYSRRGIYQIAIATKDVKLSLQQINALTRDEAESDLAFAGVLNFANQMREDTPEVIQQLSQADIQSIMLTGDNLFTGIHIARQSSIIMKDKGVLFGILSEGGHVIWKDEDDIEREEPSIVGKSATDLTVELAMSGDAWQMLLSQNRQYAISLAPFIRVFGRCSPQDKVSVVDTFTGLGFTTMMCGDGGNDCGALKAAHIGLALSDGDASLVAPFTSLRKDIADVLTVLKEGRAAMKSTMAAYKMVVLYGNVSSSSLWITLSLNVAFSEWMWIFIDVCWTVLFALTLPLARHAATLSKARPTSSLLSLQTVGSVVGIIILNYIFMAIAWVFLNNETWFQCRKIDKEVFGLSDGYSIGDNYETSVVFLMAGTQLISAAISFNLGHEYRRAWYRNIFFVVLAIGYSLLHIYITLIPGTVSCVFRINCDNDHIVREISTSELIPIGNPFNSTIMPFEFRLKLLGIMVANGLAVAVYEYFVVNGLWQRRRFKKTLTQPAIRNAEH